MISREFPDILIEDSLASEELREAFLDYEAGRGLFIVGDEVAVIRPVTLDNDEWIFTDAWDLRPCQLLPASKILAAADAWIRANLIHESVGDTWSFPLGKQLMDEIEAVKGVMTQELTGYGVKNTEFKVDGSGSYRRVTCTAQFAGAVITVVWQRESFTIVATISDKTIFHRRSVSLQLLLAGFTTEMVACGGIGAALTKGMTCTQVTSTTGKS